MRTAFVSLLLVLGAIAAPTVARACDNYDDQAYYTNSPETPNHQSSLSSTYEGAAPTCPAGDPSDENGG